MVTTGENMAKPIEPTPILEGKDVELFYETLRKEEQSPDPKRLELIKRGVDVFSKISKKP